MRDARLTAELRQCVTDRAHGCCEYCWSQARHATQAFSVEHILARARGGMTALENLALACQGCNNHKYDKTEARVPLYHPRRDQWDDHFAWSDDFTLILGLTPTGRATVAALLLNREGIVNLRRLLYERGEHPPPRLAPEQV